MDTLNEIKDISDRIANRIPEYESNIDTLIIRNPLKIIEMLLDKMDEMDTW